MICIVDYGVGNLRSIENALKFRDEALKVDVIDDPDKLRDYEKIILPGVGAFGDAIKRIRESGFETAIREEVRSGKFLLGICLGMQLLGTTSYEYGEHGGLNIIEGEVRNFRSIDETLIVPQIGWNEVEFQRDDKLLSGVQNGSDFYFVHSYFFTCANNSEVLGITEYGIRYPSIIRKGRVYGVQFHPEKSQEAGLKLIGNFVAL